MHNLLMIASLLLLGTGCDLAARQQAREEARREQVAKELKAIGESMHQRSGDAPSVETPAPAEPRSDSPPSSDALEKSSQDYPREDRTTPGQAAAN